jgi:2-polyprenyl-3-methyl-5-hydroxy-6-metoxy-1,4-benzoquinol methylase
MAHAPLNTPLELPDARGRRAIAARYRRRGERLYAGGKLATDPLYAGVAGVLAPASPLPLLDVGCGLGLLGHYLHACNVLHGYVGIDHDERKIEAGRDAALPLDDTLRLCHADVAELPDFRGHVALLDVLHYLPRARQPTLLERLASHLAPGGRLVIRNVLRAPHWRFHATVLEERLLHLTGWMRVGATWYPSADEIRMPLQAAGLKVAIAPLWGFTPFNSYLVVAHR